MYIHLKVYIYAMKAEPEDFRTDSCVPWMCRNKHNRIWSALKIDTSCAGVRVPLWSTLEFPGFEAGLRSTEVTEEDTCQRSIWADRVVTRWDVTDKRDPWRSTWSGGRAKAVEASVGRSKVLRVSWCCRKSFTYSGIWLQPSLTENKAIYNTG